MKPHEQVVIIGGGPAGIACAVQLKRYGIDPLIVEKEEIGGLVKNAWRLDNYPGYPEGISGPALVEKLLKHIERFDIRYTICEIRNSKYLEDRFILQYEDGEYSCDYLVVATGTRAKYKKQDTSGNVFTEVFPLHGIIDKNIAIVGAGDAAFDYAMTLASRNRVTIYNRGSRIGCIPALLDIARHHPNIKYIENSQPPISADYTIFAIGREPELGFLPEDMLLRREKLEQEGLIYVIGDVKNGMVRQTAVAAGDGIRAAMMIVEKLSHEGNQQDTGT